MSNSLEVSKNFT